MRYCNNVTITIFLLCLCPACQAIKGVRVCIENNSKVTLFASLSNGN